jgi:UDP-N-acetyl-D-glucosamine dehydrogenase
MPKKDVVKLPQSFDDSKNIDSFLSANKNKPVVAVQGLGFVGAVMSIVCANALNENYAVIGLDIADNDNYWKIKGINEGIFPIESSDPKVDILFNKAKIKNNLYATWDPYAYSKADVIIVDINLDVDKKSSKWKDLLGYDVDLSNFKKAIKTIGRNCKENVLILVETTVPPGTCQKIVKAIIKKEFKKRKLEFKKVFISHSYERVMPGPNYIDSIQNFYRVYSGINEKSADKAELFLKTIISTEKFPLTRLEGTNATEMAKVLENSYRAMNIAFMVEWSRFAEEANVNIFEVVKAIKMRPTHSNMMLPGIGVGGYCLTKDPLLASWSKKNLFNSKKGLDQSEMGVKINDKMPQYAFEYLKKNIKFNLSKKKILLLGISYLNDVGDTRYSPVELFYDCLIHENAIVSLHDPFVSYWEEKEIIVENDLEKIMSFQYDIIVISTGHSLYRNNSSLINYFIEMNKVMIFDTIGVFNENEISQIHKKQEIIILGRGNI